MDWHRIGASPEVKVDWSAALAQYRIDPYLVWADCTRFVGYEAAANSNEIPIALEIAWPNAPADGFKPNLLGELAIAKRNGVAYCTAEIAKSDIGALLRHQSIFRRFEYSAAVRVSAGAYPEFFKRKIEEGVSDTVIAVIDDGCPFAHAGVRDWDTAAKRWRTRVRLFWDQESSSLFERTGPQLDAIIARHTQDGGVVDEAACYAELARSMTAQHAAKYLRRMNAIASHGAHVLDIAAGRPNPLARVGYGTPDDAASKSAIAFVQLPRSAIADTSGASMNVAVLQALHYLQERLHGHDVVVNLSYGALAGPHDGSTILEMAIDALLETSSPLLAVVLPAGNGYEARTHTELTLAGEQTKVLRLHVLPNDPTDTFIEIWYPSTVGAQAPELAIQVQPPSGQATPWLAVNHGQMWAADPTSVSPLAAVVHLSRPPVDSARRMCLVAIAPTGGGSSDRPTAPHGVWRIAIRNQATAGEPVVVHAWVERDDAPFGSGRSRSQARFLSDGTSSAPGHPHAATEPIARTSTLNSIAHGKRVTVVGGYRLNDGALATYSASGPGRLGYPGPDVVAPCEQSMVLGGLLAAGNRSSLPVRMNGTSVAAPQVVRALVNLGQIDRHRPVNEQIPVSQAARPKVPAPHPPPQDPKWRRGRGMLKPVR